MTLLTTVQSACRRIGLQSPSVVATATDPTVLLLLELAQEEGRELARYGDWRVLRAEKTFTTVAAETQTDTPIPADLAGFIDETIWNRTARRPLQGPVSAQQWQAWKASNSFPVTDTFYLRGTSWLMQPVPTAGHTIAYEYRSSHWCQSSGGTTQEAWVADTDTGRLQERLMSLGLIWRYRHSRRMEWETDYDKYIFEINAALAADSPRRVIDMRDGASTWRVSPGVVVPEGSWAL